MAQSFASIQQGSRVPASVRAQAELERRKRARLHTPELERCAAKAVHFITTCCKIFDASKSRWIPFDLWSEQIEVTEMIVDNKQVIILKARQLGMTWLVLAYALWLMLFYPAAVILLYSLRDTEAVYLMSDDRLRGMFANLPPWMMMRAIDEKKSTEDKTVYKWVSLSIEDDGGHLWKLGNGSVARCFPTTAGDSYTASLAVIDEADLVPDLNGLLLRIKPTIDMGGKLILLSKANKKEPKSEFKRIYKNAKTGQADGEQWASVFLPWHVRPQRTQEWYDNERRDIEKRTGSLDDLWENYPATDAEALAPKQLDKRIPFKWCQRVYIEEMPLTEHVLTDVPGVPYIPGLRLYVLPQKHRRYCGGADPAEGNPTSDDSGFEIVDAHTGEQCAVFQGKFEPTVFALYIETISLFYNKASVLPERNNHGHAVIAVLKLNKKITVLNGDDGKPGWLDNQRGKTILYDHLADTIRTEDCILHDVATHDQITSIEGGTLSAPNGMMDDLSDAAALAQKARLLLPKPAVPPRTAAPRTSLATYRPR